MQLEQAREWVLLSPDNGINIWSWTTNYLIQWYSWTWTLNNIRVSNNAKDPLDDTFYTYTTNSSKTKFQLMALLENDLISNNNLVPTTYANYENRYPYVIWDSLWVLMEPVTNVPVQENSTEDIDLSDGNDYTAIFRRKEWPQTLSWWIIEQKIIENENNQNSSNWTDCWWTTIYEDEVITAKINLNEECIIEEEVNQWKWDNLYTNDFIDNYVSNWVWAFEWNNPNWYWCDDQAFNCWDWNDWYWWVENDAMYFLWNDNSQSFYIYNFNSWNLSYNTVYFDNNIWPRNAFVTFNNLEDLNIMIDTSVALLDENFYDTKNVYIKFNDYVLPTWWENSDNFELSPNGITITCNWANPWDYWEVNWITYTAYDSYWLYSIRENQSLLETACTSNVTSMNSLFMYDKSFNGNILSWDTSNVVYMRRMFFSTDLFNRDIGWWDTSNVTNMAEMFTYSDSFNQDLRNWCVSNISSKPDRFDTYSIFSSSLQPQWWTCPDQN